MKLLTTHYRWLIVAAGGLLGCVAIGGLFALPVLLRPIAQDTGWSTTGISTAMTLAFIAMALGSVAWGNLSDQYWPAPGGAHRRGAAGGGAVAGEFGVVLADVSALLWGGGGSGGLGRFPPLMACVTGWFDASQPRGVAGLGWLRAGAHDHVAPRRLAGAGHDWRSTLQIVAAIVAGLMVPTAL